MKITMRRTVNDLERYYTLQLVGNLFGEILLIRTFGSMKSRRPTGTITEVFEDNTSAEESLRILIRSKTKKGYEPTPPIK